jgi:hypothetical protein
MMPSDLAVARDASEAGAFFVLSAAQHHAQVGIEPPVVDLDLARVKEGVERGVNQLDHARLQVVGLDRLVLIVRGLDPERIGPDAQVRIHRHEDGGALRVLVAQLAGHLQDGVVTRGGVQRRAQLGPALRHENGEPPSRADGRALPE